MTLQAKTLLNMIAGAIAGVLAWLLTDATHAFSSIFNPNVLIGPGHPGYLLFLLYGGIAGVVLGILLGIVDAFSLDTLRQRNNAILFGAVLGFAGGMIGLALGQAIWGLIAPLDVSERTAGDFVRELIGRAIGWAVIGGFLGASQGASHRSGKIVVQAAFGGLLGGALGGIVFQVAAYIISPSLGRLAALSATGAMIGFFIGLVQVLFKQAWVRVVLGKNEGKEYPLAKLETAIGRSELADIALFGDANVAPTHAVIETHAEQRRHRLRHVAQADRSGKTYGPTIVNGQPITGEQWLTDGDTIQIGKRTLRFHEKWTRNAPKTQPAPRPRPAAQPAHPAAPAGSAEVTRLVTPAPAAPEPVRSSAPERVPDEALASPDANPVFPAYTPPSFVDSEKTVLTQPGAEVPVGRIGTRLLATEGPYAGRSFALSHAPVSIGRAEEREIALVADTAASRNHAQILYEGGRHVLRDAGSSNGTYVNGRKLEEPHMLRLGDHVMVGKSTLRYE